jgi:dienelactone hydrolase
MKYSLPAAIFFATLAAPAAAQLPARIPVAAFVKFDQFARPRMSPDGKHLAVAVNMEIGKRQVPTITFYSLPDLKIEATVRMKAFEVPAGFDWVSNQRIVVSKALEVGSREAPQLTGEIVAMNYDGSKQEYLYGHDNFRYGRQSARYGDDYGFAYVADIPMVRDNTAMFGTRLWRVDHSTLIHIDTLSGIRKQKAQLPYRGMQFLVRNDGVPGFAFGYDNENKFMLFRYDAAGDQWKREDNKRVGSALRPLAVTADNQEFIGTYSALGGPDTVIRENMATGERKVIASDGENSVLRMMNGSRRDIPIAAITTVGRPRVIHFDETAPESQLHKLLSAQFPDSVVHFIDFTDDGSKLLFSVQSDRDPGSYYLYDRHTNGAVLLLVAMEDIEPDAMAPRQPLEFKARDGLKLEGYLTRPVNSAGKKLPMVLLPHGGPFGPRDEWYFDTEAQFLANRGYAVLQVNFRGSGGHGANFRHSGFLQWGDKIIDDLMDGTRQVIEQGGIDEKRMCVYGGSFGGYAALRLAQREPDMFKCAIGYAGVYELGLLLDEHEVKASQSTAKFYADSLGKDKKELERISPTRHADAIKIPVMLIHGGKDQRAPKEHAFLMKSALEKAGRPPEWFYIDYEGHGFYDTENLTEVYNRLEAFLAKHIGK